MGYEGFLNKARDINRSIAANPEYEIDYKEGVGLLWNSELVRFIKDTKSTIRERNGLALVTSINSGKRFRMRIKADVDDGNETLWVDFNEVITDTSIINDRDPHVQLWEPDLDMGREPDLDMGREQYMQMITTTPGKVRIIDSDNTGTKLVEMETVYGSRIYVFRYNTKEVSGTPDGLSHQSICLLGTKAILGGN